MRLYEFDQSPDMSVSMDILVDQLKSDLDNNKLSSEMSVNKFLEYCSHYDILVSEDDLYDMIQVPPLDKLIDNIKPDPVTGKKMIVFKGEEQEQTTIDQDTDQEKTVAQMAKKAMKR